MANYKIIFKATSNGPGVLTHWEPGCPLLIDAVQVSRNTQTGAAYLQLKLRNLTNRTLGSFDLRTEVTYQDGTGEIVETNPLDADIAPGCSYTPEPTPLTQGAVVDASARVLAVSEESAYWQSERNAQPLPQGALLDLGQAALVERRNILEELGRSAGTYSARVLAENNWWVCPCGTPNVDRDCCLACHMPLETLRQLEDESHLHAKIAERAAAGKAKTRKGRRIAIAAVTAIAIAFGAGVFGEFVIQPELQRQATADREAEANQRSDERRQQFEEEKRQVEEERQAFLNAERSCSALVTMTKVREFDDQLRSTVSYMLDEKGNVISASRFLEETGATRTVNITVNDIGFPLAITDENGAVLSEFTIEASNNVGLPLQVTQTSADGATTSYTLTYDSDNNLTGLEQELDDQKFWVTLGDSGWGAGYSDDASSITGLIMEEGSFRGGVPNGAIDKEIGENGRYSMYAAGGSKFEYVYESVAAASPWTAIVAQMPTDIAPLPYNIWLGTE